MMVERFKPVGIGNETVLKKIIDKQCIEKNTADRNGKVRESLYASDVFQCPRKIFFQFFPDKYVSEEFDPRTIRIFQNGDSVHERLSQYLHREKAIRFIEESDIPRDELEVHGRCDGLALIDGRLTVIEFKSINKTSVTEPKEEHMGQITWYMAMWNRLRLELREDFNIQEETIVTEELLKGELGISGRYYEDLEPYEQLCLLSSSEPVGELIYESKQNQALFNFSVEWNTDRIAKVRAWFEMVKWHVDREIVPLVRYPKDKFPCRWGFNQTAGQCAFYKQCHDE